MLAFPHGERLFRSCGANFLVREDGLTSLGRPVIGRTRLGVLMPGSLLEVQSLRERRAKILTSSLIYAILYVMHILVDIKIWIFTADINTIR